MNFFLIKICYALLIHFRDLLYSVHLLNTYIADLRQLAIAKSPAAAIMFQESESVKYLEIEPAIDELG